MTRKKTGTGTVDLILLNTKLLRVYLEILATTVHKNNVRVYLVAVKF